MQQPLTYPRDDRAAYEYTIQPTDDRHDGPTEDARWGRESPPWQSGSTPNYKPKPLRWPFISTVIALLLVAIILVVVAETQMPNSDSSVRIMGLHPNATQPVRFARAALTNTSVSAAEVITTDAGVLSTTPSQTPETSLTSNDGTRVQSVDTSTTSQTPTTPLIAPSASTLSSSRTMSPPSRSAPTNVASASSTTAVSSSTKPVSASTTATLPSGARVVPVSESVSRFTTNITVPVTTVTYTSEFTSVETITFSSDSTFATTFVSTVTNGGTTFYSHFTANGTQGSTPVSTGTGTQVGVITVTSSVTSATVGASTRTTVGTITATSTITGVVIPSVGEVTITYYSTILPPAGIPVTQPPNPVKVTGVDVIDETSVAVVQTQGPVIVAVTSNEVKTQVVNQQVSTGVARVGGSVVTNVLVITPTPGDSARFVTNTIVDNVGGTPVTRVVVTITAGPPFTPISYTVVRDAGGTLVTEVIVTTPTGVSGQPLTFTAVDIVGGTPVTQVVVTTANGAPFQPVSYTITTNIGGTPTVVTITPGPTTIVETINGTPVTRVTTPPVTSFTTTMGATLITQTVVTTPTGTEPITLTLLSTSGDTLSTFTTTIPPTTFLTTISGTPRTITSTPSPRTSFSTRPKSTRTFTSTSLSTPSSPTPTTDPNNTTVIASTRVYGWTEADIFLGTFLPPLLGVALVIPLRIIDLNAKLYQPFQALATQGGGSSTTGRDTLLLQYTGWMSFAMPLLTLLRAAGRPQPVPFLTTLMVGCASLMVPLATEAVGLKLHGECWLNTASETCGPALGVSPGPAHALVGLLAAVVVLLGVVGWLVGRWVTGVFANPWSLAGVASLVAGSGLIRQDGEAAMRRAVEGRQYGLGYFRNAGGREAYGIVLVDEAGRGLHRGEDGPPVVGDSGSEMLGDSAAGAKWAGQSQQLPFMALRYPWRIVFVLFQLAVLVLVIYYHAYYRGGIRDNGRLWLFLNSNTFGIRFVSAIVGVVIAFCWQAFFLSVSTMTPFRLLSICTQPPTSSILFTPSTNPFSGIYSSVRHRQPFLFAVSLAAILSEFLPVILSNVPFNLAQTGTAATACAVLSCLFLGFMLAVLGVSFFVRYPPMPVDPRCVAGLMWYVSKSAMLEDFEGVSRLEGHEREQRVKEMGRRYFYGVLMGSGEGTRLGVDCDVGGGGEEGMGYQGAQGLRTRG
ncbi:Zonadhesin [Chaetomidium leptoderma]|uniref:Zonadhesin n=1 Tax=Chaetomidium leptoderma TaxID=669021 RepID=A0AAN6ZZS0_9PEZI|nr:Zonadhesin [Chaetomidium leptoderma]